MSDSIEPILTAITTRVLEAPAVRAIWLAGSQARGEAHELSDIDIGVIAEDGTPFRVDVERIDGRLVTVTWVTAAATRASFENPDFCGTAVCGWRDARLLHDADGIGAELISEATEWTWEGREETCDAWVAARVTEYAEAASKLIAAMRAGDDVAAAAQGSFLAFRLPIALSAHLRLMYPNWRTLWRVVGEALGDEWTAHHRAALGVDARGAEAARAALALYVDAVDRARPSMTATQLEVVGPVRDLALAAL